MHLSTTTVPKLFTRKYILLAEPVAKKSASYLTWTNKSRKSTFIWSLISNLLTARGVRPETRHARTETSSLYGICMHRLLGNNCGFHRAGMLKPVMNSQQWIVLLKKMNPFQGFVTPLITEGCPCFCVPVWVATITQRSVFLRRAASVYKGWTWSCWFKVLWVQTHTLVSGLTKTLSLQWRTGWRSSIYLLFYNKAADNSEQISPLFLNTTQLRAVTEVICPSKQAFTTMCSTKPHFETLKIMTIQLENLM